MRTPSFGLPNFELPQFDLSKMEMPAAFRQIAETGVANAKDAYEKARVAVVEATDFLKDTHETAAKGAKNHNLKLIEFAGINTNTAFDYAKELFGAKSLSELIELSTAHARKQFEAITEQTKELVELAQKITSETAVQSWRHVDANLTHSARTEPRSINVPKV